MFGTDASNSTPTRPTPAAAGTSGWFQNGTNTDPDVLNGMLAELLNVVTTAGGTPSKTNVGQVLAGLATIFAAVPTVLTASGNPDAPTWASRVLALAWAPGGAGGAGNSSGGGGGGGSGGGFGASVLACVGGNAVNCVIGSSTSVGGTAMASAGVAGTAATSSAVGTGSYGGTGTGTLLSVSGGGSQNGLLLGGTSFGGMGGGSFGSSATYFPQSSGSVPGNFPGGGGSGGAGTGSPGGAGGGGLIILIWLK